MKLSAITVLLSAALVPFAAVSGTVFTCSVKTTFEGKDKTKDPAVPSKPILNWMADDLMQTFLGAYRDNEDFNMVSDKFNKFSMKRSTTTTVDQEEGDVVVNGRTEGYLEALTAKLRGTPEVEGKRSWYSWWLYYYRSKTKVTCNYCGHPDDDYRLGEKANSVGEMLMASEEHKTWEATFCDSLHASEFPTAAKCEIHIYDCSPETPEDSDASAVVTADTYVVSDYRNVLKDGEEGVAYTLETMESHVANEPLLAE